MPSELEWEKAARGGLTDAVYAWGDTPDPDRANYDDSGVGDTSVVGCFPANDFGLHDIIGNVWEWTRSLWGKDLWDPDFVYPYEPDDPNREDLEAGNDVSRAVRGGAWRDVRDYARCACREGGRPDGRSGIVGFRVVLRSAPVR
ncbi:MAG: formylglycine-generating enzyme family protein [Pseudomonadota bacterium]|nr:formylglycine-generating enzyme family protein [Pseudomonadota bacterium]